MSNLWVYVLLMRILNPKTIKKSKFPNMYPKKQIIQIEIS